MTIEAKELLRNAVKNLQTKRNTSDDKGRNAGRESDPLHSGKLIAKVVQQQDQMMIDAIKQAVDEGLVHTAYMIDRDYIQELFTRMEPRAVLFKHHGMGTCPCCGKDIYKGFNQQYCEFCGQAIAWEITP